MELERFSVKGPISGEFLLNLVSLNGHALAIVSKFRF